MKNIAFLGLGAMGERMAARLIQAGHHVTVWNRTPARAIALQKLGANIAPTPREAARGADFVISMVYDVAASTFVWLDAEHGAAAVMSPHAIAIESSTISADCVVKLAADTIRYGTRFIDAPVAGSRPQAEAGQLIFMAGGESADVETATPILKVMGSAVHHVGPHGSGMLLKLTVNAMFGIQVAMMGELLAFLAKSNVDVPRALDALRAMPIISPAAAGASALILAKNDAPQAPVDLIAKDLRYALDSANKAGARLPATENALARYWEAQAAGLGDRNIVAVAQLFA